MIINKAILYTFMLWMWLFLHTVSAAFPAAVRTLMASREERYSHYLWHNIRNNWNRYSTAVQNEITRRGWNPPRPAMRYDSNGNSIAISDNNSGEDFLYMHRQMIKKVKDLVLRGNEEDALVYLTGWTNIPKPTSGSYPVPANYTISGSPGTTSSLRTFKSPSFYYDRIAPLESQFKDFDELRQMTLGELGTALEFTVHNWLHMRYSSSESYGYRPGGSGPFPIFDSSWDNVAYDWLGDTYSSHVNPIFWKIHGWVDSRVDLWCTANGVTNINWKGTWMGGPMSTIQDIIKPRRTFSGSLVAATTSNIASSGPVIESSFADNVVVNVGGLGKSKLIFNPIKPQKKSKPAKRRLRNSRRV